MTKDFLCDEVQVAVTTIQEKLRCGSSSYLAEHVRRWMEALSATGNASDYFTQDSIFPMLLLPAWMANSVPNGWDQKFQSDLIYSTVNGYYFIRMLDNVMDGHASCERQLLPVSAFFYSEFQSTYQRYFDASHPFWGFFHRLWLESIDATVREAQLETMDLVTFRDTAAKKLSPAKVPLIAVHYQLGKCTDLARWLAFCDQLGKWWQFLDDLMDWYNDLQQGACTYFLSQARCHRQDGEAIFSWVAREGFQWALDTLHMWMESLEAAALELGSDDAIIFLQQRQAMVTKIAGDLMPGMHELQKLAVAMQSNITNP